MSATTPSPSPRLFYHPAYWCHSCDMSIGLPPSPTPTSLLCPHCHRDSLEQLDSSSLTPSDDTFLLSSPYLHRLIHQLTTPPNPNNPAPKSAISSLQDHPVTDPTLLCPICKDPFAPNSLAKLLPCKHSYHSQCILPWLQINNSCPVCRYRLSVGGDDGGREEERMRFVRLEELVDYDYDDDDDEGGLYSFRTALRRIAATPEGNVGGGSEGSLFSPTQVGEVEGGGGVLERENSVETVSSWPRWRVEDGAGGGDGRGNGGGGGDGFRRI